MDERDERHQQSTGTEQPGRSPDWRSGLVKPLLGLAASIVLTLASFWVAGTQLVWGPGVPVLLAALAIGQMGVHLVFFLHVSSGPESTNTILALAFGVFVVALVVFGSLMVMRSLDANMATVLPGRTSHLNVRYPAPQEWSGRTRAASSTPDCCCALRCNA